MDANIFTALLGTANRMTLHDQRKWRKLRNQLMSERDVSKLLDTILALDRIVVELSMRIYNVPRRDRFVMRKQNRRLHNAVRQRLPRLLEPSRNPSWCLSQK